MANDEPEQITIYKHLDRIEAYATNAIRLLDPYIEFKRVGAAEDDLIGILDAVKTIRVLNSKSIDKNYHTSQQASANMIKALMIGLDTKKDKE